jgi:hypothetical protein
LDVVTLLLIILAVLLCGVVGFVGVQRKRRAGGVIAAKPRRHRDRP